jgi:RNA polymerase sigma factor (sigma-70 family)
VDRNWPLVEALRRRESTAAERLLETYGDRVHRLALRITGNAQDAEEVVQDVFWSVLRHIDTFRGESLLGSWIYRITFNQAPRVGTTGRLAVHQDDGTIVDTIDMSLSSQSRLNGTVSFNYFPIIVTGNTAAIYLHRKLAYDRTYFVTIEPGVITDTSGAPFAGIADQNTWAFSTRFAGPGAGTNALTVAADGSGDFCTVQGAVDFVPAGNSNRVVINVRSGTFVYFDNTTHTIRPEHVMASGSLPPGNPYGRGEFPAVFPGANRPPLNPNNVNIPALTTDEEPGPDPNSEPVATNPWNVTSGSSLPGVISQPQTPNPPSSNPPQGSN